MSEHSLSTQVSQEILRKIRSGEIEGDTLITEAMICETSGLSRTPVREALIGLRANGVLEKVPNKGYRVKQMDEKAKNDIYIVLSYLDALAARLAINKMTEEDYLKMSELIDLIDISIKYRNFANYQEQQEAFHSVYIERSGNEALKHSLDQIKESVPRYTYFSNDEDRLFAICASTNNEHREILQMLRDHKTEEITQYLIYTHWQTKYEDAI